MVILNSIVVTVALRKAFNRKGNTLFKSVAAWLMT